MKKIIIIVLVIVFIITTLIYLYIFNNKIDETSLDSKELNTLADDSVIPEPQIEIAENAIYKIDFIANWSKQTHPNNYPIGAHFSPFVAYAHNNLANSKIFQKGKRPSHGIEEMAETGNTKILNQEIDKLINSKLAYKKTQSRVFDSPGSESSQLEINKDYSYMTFVSMLAPSPDWFVSETTNLIKEGQWIDQIELNLITYDAGGDNGETLTAQDANTNPKGLIVVFLDNLQGLGKIVLTKIK